MPLPCLCRFARSVVRVGLPAIIAAAFPVAFALAQSASPAAVLPSVVDPSPSRESAADPTRADRASRLNGEEGARSLSGATIANPLEPYLDRWIRPRDQALLRDPKNAPAATSPETWRRLVVAPAQARPGPEASAKLPTGPTANPYIAAMSVPASAPPASAVSPPTSPSPVAPPTTGEPLPSATDTEAPPPPPRGPYRPPPSDRKYFPQLKRF